MDNKDQHRKNQHEQQRRRERGRESGERNKKRTPIFILSLKVCLHFLQFVSVKRLPGRRNVKQREDSKAHEQTVEDGRERSDNRKSETNRENLADVRVLHQS
jgi:hypothetical protein